MNIFIDTNVFLSLYHFTTDQLDDLRKLQALLYSSRASLYLPEQTEIEFRRNRDNKLADALKRLGQNKVQLQMPTFAREFREHGDVRRAEIELKKALAVLEKLCADRAAKHELGADKAIAALFAKAKRISSEQVISAARLRRDLGNPPGKPDSLGDAINWEALLAKVPADQDLHFISADSDFASPLDPGIFNSFLDSEWRSKKQSKVCFYTRLSDFLQKHFPDATSAADLERDLLIRDLEESGSFAETHRIVGLLGRNADLTSAQRRKIAEATIQNNQIGWIATDPDLKEFLEAQVLKCDELDPGVTAQVRSLIYPQEGILDWSLNNDDLPF